MDTETGLNRPATTASASRAPGQSMTAVVLDLIRPPDRPLRILEAADAADSLSATSTPDEIVGVLEAGRNGAAGRFEEGAFDCAVGTEIVHRLDPAERHSLLARLRRAARGAVLLELPRAGNGHNPFDEAIEFFRELGDSVLVLSEEHLPALLTLREAGLGDLDSNGRSPGPASMPLSGDLAGLHATPPRSLLVALIDPGAAGIEVEALHWCSAPVALGRDPAGLAVLPLALEVRQLSDRLAGERARADRAEAVAGDLRAKVAELTRIASEDRAARESAEQLVEIVAAARGYRIGLAICHARAAVRRRAGSAWRWITTPWRKVSARLRRAPAADGP
jgi:hypothetical protein